jgi:hypothetical protein
MTTPTRKDFVEIKGFVDRGLSIVEEEVEGPGERLYC